MKLLCIDPGFQNLGWAVIEFDLRSNHICVKATGNDVLVTDPSSDIMQMYNAVLEWGKGLKAKIADHEIDRIEMERSFYDRRPSTNWLSYTLAILESCLYSVLKSVFQNELGIPAVNMIPASAVKRSLRLATGNHANNKAAVLEYISQKNPEFPKMTNHIADCIGLAIYVLSKWRDCDHRMITLSYDDSLF